MADQGTKKVIIPRLSLPPAGKHGEYLVRYRIASQDKNRYSHWSYIHKVTGKPLSLVNGSIAQINSIIMVTWESVPGIASYDIFIKYNNQTNYTYHGASVSNNYSIVSQGGSSVEIAVQIGGIIKERRTVNTIFLGTLSLV